MTLTATRARRLAATAALLIAALGCAHGRGPDELPPFTRGKGRIIVFRETSSAAPQFVPHILVDTQDAGKLGLGRFLWLDAEPGSHSIVVERDAFHSAFNEQSSWRIANATVTPGKTSYVRLQVVVLGDSIQTELKEVDESVGARSVAPLSEAPPEAGD